MNSREIIIFTFLSVFGFCHGQDIILFENFDSLKTSNLTATNGWIKDNLAITPSNNYKGASGSYFFGAANLSQQEESLVLSKKIEAKKYTSVKISWGAYKDALFPGAVLFQWSKDGEVWKDLKYNDVKSNGTWARVQEITLPKEAEELEKMWFKWTYKGNDNANYYAIDDLIIKGKPKDETNLN
jgi:hypothetical protein